MKTTRNILIAFILNLSFSIFEFIGGIITGSVAILSDATHDMADAASIGISYILEKKSKRQPDQEYTYGYARYSVIGSLITTMILIVGSVAILYNSVYRIFQPTQIHYDGMIVFAIAGVIINFGAAFITRGGESLNQKAVNLHMLEDVLGWVVVLVGAVIMRFTDLAIIDPLMSIGVSLFILVNSLKNLKEILAIFLEKTPSGIAYSEIKEHICQIDGVLDVHHIHLWSIDGQNHSATMHIVTGQNPHKVKDAVREQLRKHGIGHTTIETETIDECCHEKECKPEHHTHTGHCHHHHHHHHH